MQVQDAIGINLQSLPCLHPLNILSPVRILSFLVRYRDTLPLSHLFSLIPHHSSGTEPTPVPWNMPDHVIPSDWSALSPISQVSA